MPRVIRQRGRGSTPAGEEAGGPAAASARTGGTELHLDPAAAAANRQARLHRLNTVSIPALRLFGLTIFAAAALLHNAILDGAVDWGRFVPFFLGVEGYALLSWAVLRAYYGRTRIDLADLFLTADMVPLAWTVYLTGAEQSWLFFVLLARVGDQSTTTARRVRFFAHLAVAAYLLMVAYADLVGTVAWDEALTRAVFLYLTGFYLSLTARTAEQLRLRTSEAVRVARQAVGELNRRSRQLEERTRELEVARGHAEKGGRARTDFLSRVSHELRTPLNSILGFGQLLQDDELSQEQRLYLEEVMRGARRLLKVVDDVLRVADAQMGKLSASLHPVAIEPLVTSAIAALQPIAAARRIHMKAAPGGDVYAVVLGDEAWIEQIVTNLLTNAIRYNRDEGVVDVQCRRMDSRLRLSVSDTGPGIDRDRADRLFAPFERLGMEARGVPGVGMGLAVSKALTEAMGGAMGVESRPGEGATFWVELPLATEDAGYGDEALTG